MKVRDWEAQEGRHSGGYVLDELQQIVQSRIDIELERVQHMVSIVIPVLNEERTIEEVLKSVTAAGFSAARPDQGSDRGRRRLDGPNSGACAVRSPMRVCSGSRKS